MRERRDLRTGHGWFLALGIHAQTNHSGAACLQLHRQVEESARLEARTLRCFAGLFDSAVPVRVGDKLVASLQPGEVLPAKPRRREFSRAAARLAEFGAQFDEQRLEQAYFETRVVLRKNHESILRLLSIFAQRLSVLSNQLMVTGQAAEMPGIARARAHIAEHYSGDLSLPGVARRISIAIPVQPRLPPGRGRSPTVYRDRLHA